MIRQAARITKGRSFLAFAVPLAMIAGTSAAQERIDESKPASEDGRVTISNVSGSVRVVGWNQREIKIEGTLGRGTDRLDFDVDGDRARIKVVLPRRARNVDGTDLEIRVPKGSDVEIETVSAWIEVSEVIGELELKSVSGDVTASGEPENIRAESVSGEIEIQATCEDVRAESVSGDVEIIGPSGELEAQSVSGDVIIRGDTFTGLQAETVSGDVRFEGAITGRGQFDFQSHSGDVRLRLRGNVSAEFEISTFSGDIENAFGDEERERKRRSGPGRDHYFTLGDGDAEVSVSTFSGDVYLQEVN